MRGKSGVEGGSGEETLLGQSRYRNAASADAGQTGGAWPATQGLAPAGMPRPAVAFPEEHDAISEKQDEVAWNANRQSDRELEEMV